ncbi:LacI family DNA-binding transcriptional regulator [Populibacterium corticicola]|uniref:LacI family DNA-binding transcriptional regulator n=1 Tax=Populibacterium corticicola TaxID=1812826 RepID=A0ABW5XF92_9MICO
MPAPAKKRPTVRDVAAAAGVSRGTVSRVINGGHWVSDEARAAVEAAIKATGYSLNQHARSLATGRSNSIAFLLTEPQHLLFEDPTFSTLLRSCAEVLGGREMPMLLMVAGTEKERKRITEYISSGHVDGVIVVSSHRNNPVIADLVAKGIPTVACGAPLGHEDQVGYVAVDEVGSARRIVDYLRSKYQRVAMITGPLDTPGGLFRLDGYRLAMGSDYDDSLVAHGDYSRASGAQAMRDLMQGRPDIDAVFAASDLMAVGAMAALHAAGKSVPGDVAVAGFDDHSIASTSNPPLTTMKQPFERIASEVVRVLLGVIEGDEHAAVILPANLVERESA